MSVKDLHVQYQLAHRTNNSIMNEPQDGADDVVKVRDPNIIKMDTIASLDRE
jgi:hypothetical protein